MQTLAQSQRCDHRREWNPFSGHTQGTSLWVHAPNAFHLLVANEQREHNSTGWPVGAQSDQLIASQHCPD